MSTSPMTSGKRLALAAAWGALCGLAGFAIEAWQRDHWRSDQWMNLGLAGAVGAVFAEVGVRRLSPSLQLLSLTASLGGIGLMVSAVVGSDSLVVLVWFALTATATASVINLFAPRSSPLLRVVAAYALSSLACVAIAAVLLAQGPNARSLDTFGPREFTFFVIYGLFGCAGVPPLPRED